MLDRFGSYSYRVICPVCQERQSFLVVGDRGKGFIDQRLVMCKNCSHIMQNPYNSKIVEKYRNNTYSKSERSCDVPTNKHLSESLAKSNDRFDKLKPYLPEDGTLLDIGCGAGTFMKAFKDNGYKARGMEVSTGFAEYAVEQGHIVYNVGTLEDLPSDFDNDINIISMIHVIEHLEDPRKTLMTMLVIYKNLSTLIIEYPDYWRAADRGSFDPDTYFHEYHVHDFTESSIIYLLASNGFKFRMKWVGDKFPSDKNVLLILERDEEFGDEFWMNKKAYLPHPEEVYEKYVRMKILCGAPVGW